MTLDIDNADLADVLDAEAALDAALQIKNWALARRIGEVFNLPDPGWCSTPYCPVCRAVGGYCGS